MSLRAITARTGQAELIVAVRVCGWSEERMSANADALNTIAAYARNAWRMGLTTEDMEDDIVDAHGDAFVDVMVETEANRLDIWLEAL